MATDQTDDQYDPLQPTDIVLPDWETQQAQTNLYAFSTSLGGLDVSRLRRVESALQFRRRGITVQADSSFAAVPTDVLTTSGQISLTTGDIAQLGSLPPFVADGLFAATATTTSITWYWDGTNGSRAFVMRRADATNFTVPKLSLTISGLVANTKYYFYPYWPVVAGCGVGWIVGTDGSPKIAFLATSPTAAAAQIRQDREAMTSGALNYTTPAAGTSTGPGGGLPCVMQGTDIEPLEDWEYSKEIHQETQWMRVTANGKTLCCTPNHPVYTAYGERRRADELRRGDWLTMQDGDYQLESSEPFIQTCTKIKVVMPKGHLFWANGFLCHNNKAADP